MYFANPWGLLGLIALPTILFIHLYQRRFPPLEIGGLHLWASEEQTKTAGRRLDRLPITKSLLLELLAVVLLTLLLARPQLANLGTTTHWIFVLDNSASMMASVTGGASFRDRALAEVQSRVTSTDRNSRVSVILTGRRPTMLVGPAIKWQEAQQSLANWQPQDTQHDFQSAWDMASQLGENTGNLVFITDDISQDDGMPPSMELVSVGQPLPNIAFETARWSLESQSLKESLYLRLHNFSDQPAKAEIVCNAGDTQVFRQSLEFKPKSSLPLATELPGGLRQISLEIQSQNDRLSTDSRLELIEPEARPVDVALALADDYPGFKQLKRILSSLPAVNLETSDNADFVITEGGVSLDLPDNRWQLAIGPIDKSDQARDSSIATTGPFLIERRNSLVEGLSLSGVIWSGFQENQVSLAPMISAGTKILFGQRTDMLFRSFVLNIDLSQSNLADSPDWPILISNLIEACRDSRPGLRRWNYHVNEIIRFDVGPVRGGADNPEPLSLKSAVRTRSLVRARTVEIPPLSAVGVYSVVDGDETIGSFAVNFFDRRESDLSALGPGQLDPLESSTGAMQLSETATWVWMALIAVTMLVAIYDWAVLKPKRTEAVVA